MNNELLISRKLNDYERLGIKEEIKISKETKYIKYIESDYKRITKMYNSKNEFIGVDIINMEEVTKEVIYKKETGETIVILHNGDKNYKGVSKCHENDYYSPQKGYDIAIRRAKIKILNEELKKLCK